MTVVREKCKYEVFHHQQTFLADGRTKLRPPTLYPLERVFGLSWSEGVVGLQSAVCGF